MLGEYGWGGAGSTVYFCDKKEKIVVVFMTELLQGRLNMKRRIKECLYGVSFPKRVDQPRRGCKGRKI